MRATTDALPVYYAALLNPNISKLIQKCHPYTVNLNPETSRDSKNVFLHWGDVAGRYEVAGPGGLARATSGMRNLGDTGSSSLYRLGSLAALSPGFLGISAPAAPRR